MPVPQMSWDLIKIIIAILVVIIVIAFTIVFGNLMSESSCPWINGMIDKFSIGYGWFRIGLPHVC